MSMTSQPVRTQAEPSQTSQADSDEPEALREAELELERARARFSRALEEASNAGRIVMNRAGKFGKPLVIGVAVIAGAALLRLTLKSRWRPPLVEFRTVRAGGFLRRALPTLGMGLLRIILRRVVLRPRHRQLSSGTTIGASPSLPSSREPG